MHLNPEPNSHAYAMGRISFLAYLDRALRQWGLSLPKLGHAMEAKCAVCGVVVLRCVVAMVQP